MSRAFPNILSVDWDSGGASCGFWGSKTPASLCINLKRASTNQSPVAGQAQHAVPGRSDTKKVTDETLALKPRNTSKPQTP